MPASMRLSRGRKIASASAGRAAIAAFTPPSGGERLRQQFDAELFGGFACLFQAGQRTLVVLAEGKIDPFRVGDDAHQPLQPQVVACGQADAGDVAAGTAQIGNDASGQGIVDRREDDRRMLFQVGQSLDGLGGRRARDEDEIGMLGQVILDDRFELIDLADRAGREIDDLAVLAIAKLRQSLLKAGDSIAIHRSELHHRHDARCGLLKLGRIFPE